MSSDELASNYVVKQKMIKKKILLMSKKNYHVPLDVAVHHVVVLARDLHHGHPAQEKGQHLVLLLLILT